MEVLSPHFQKKQHTLLQANSNAQKTTYLNKIQVDLSIHGIALRFHVDSEELVSELYDHYPLAWFQKTSAQPAIDIFWINNNSLGWADEEWSNEITPDCHVFTEGARQMALQRDFAALLEKNQCHVICAYRLDDGFFNFLRWLLPVLLMEQGKLVLHSSCVIDAEGFAYFSLGPSGAGKSTIASYRARKKILGDDMNIIKFENNQCWAQAGAIGQSLLNPAEYSNWYPVKAFFWLKKAEQVSIAPLSKAAQIRFLSSAVANVFWNQLDAHKVQTVFVLVCQLLQQTSLYELSFPKREKVWEEIFANLREVQKS